MKIVCILALFWIQTFRGATVPPCCTTKIVGGVDYILSEGEEVLPGYSTVCLSDCVYKKKDANSGDKYCFGAGNLTVECDSTCVKDVTGDNFEYLGDCLCAPVKNILTHSDNETDDGNDGNTTYWLGPNGSNANFTLDLGCQQTFDGIQLVNTHNSYHRDRATKMFNLYVGQTNTGPWTLVLVALLYDSRNQTDPLPLQKLSLTAGEQTAQFIKFELITAWGLGGGLQYFDIVRKSDVPAPVPAPAQTTGDRIICDENLNKLHELLLDANNTIDVRCCANGNTNKTVSCGNGTNCSSVCGDTPTCAKMVVNAPKEGKNYCESKDQNTQAIHAIFIGTPCNAITNNNCINVSTGTIIGTTNDPKPNTYCNEPVEITAPDGNGGTVTLVSNFDFTASCASCPSCAYCSICTPEINDKIAEFIDNLYEN